MNTRSDTGIGPIAGTGCLPFDARYGDEKKGLLSRTGLESCRNFGDALP